MNFNFPTAQLIAKAGKPIARSSWLSETDAMWLTFQGGNVWFLHTTTGREIVTSGLTPNVTEEDLRAQDWQVPDGCEFAAVTGLENFLLPGGTVETGGAFDVLNPPCSI